MNHSTSTNSERSDRLPPSCRYVLFVLEDVEEASRQELLDLTDLPETTLDRALQTLQNEHLVVKTRKSDDPTQVVAHYDESRPH